MPDHIDLNAPDILPSAPAPDAADPQRIVNAKIPADLLEKYEVYSYRNAAVILSETLQEEFGEILEALRSFTITTRMIRIAGGNESEIPKLLSASLRPRGWNETTISADLLVKLEWKEQIGAGANGKPLFLKRNREIRRKRYLDGHKIDYVKNKVAFDLEWNSKDQTFDRDLYAFNAFFMAGAIDVGILVTRSQELNAVFRSVGPALRKNGEIELTARGLQRPTFSKYGASTTWMGKLLYRLNAGRNGGCPVLAVGIKNKCVSDWQPPAVPVSTAPIEDDEDDE